MKNLPVIIFSGLSILLLPYFAYGQQAEAPVYKDGDWWKVKAEHEWLGGSSRSGACHEIYSEYMVKFENGKAVVYGLKGNNSEKIDCLPAAEQLLSVTPEGQERTYQYLKYPLTVGSSWTEQVSRTTFRGKTRQDNLEYKVLSWEKVQTPKGEFEAFKIQQTGRGERVTTYYYSPQAKAIVEFEFEAPNLHRKVSLVDLYVSE